MTKLSMNNLGKIAESNPFLDMRQIEEWRAINRDMKRLGVDLSRPTDVPVRKNISPRQVQRISLKHF